MKHKYGKERLNPRSREHLLKVNYSNGPDASLEILNNSGMNIRNSSRETILRNTLNGIRNINILPKNKAPLGKKFSYPVTQQKNDVKLAYNRNSTNSKNKHRLNIKISQRRRRKRKKHHEESRSLKNYGSRESESQIVKNFEFQARARQAPLANQYSNYKFEQNRLYSASPLQTDRSQDIQIPNEIRFSEKQFRSQDYQSSNLPVPQLNLNFDQNKNDHPEEHSPIINTNHLNMNSKINSLYERKASHNDFNKLSGKFQNEGIYDKLSIKNAPSPTNKEKLESISQSISTNRKQIKPRTRESKFTFHRNNPRNSSHHNKKKTSHVFTKGTSPIKRNTNRTICPKLKKIPTPLVLNNRKMQHESTQFSIETGRRPDPKYRAVQSGLTNMENFKNQQRSIDNSVDYIQTEEQYDKNNSNFIKMNKKYNTIRNPFQSTNNQNYASNDSNSMKQEIHSQRWQNDEPKVNSMLPYSSITQAQQKSSDFQENPPNGPFIELHTWEGLTTARQIDDYSPRNRKLNQNFMNDSQSSNQPNLAYGNSKQKKKRYQSKELVPLETHHQQSPNKIQQQVKNLNYSTKQTNRSGGTTFNVYHQHQHQELPYNIGNSYNYNQLGPNHSSEGSNYQVSAQHKIQGSFQPKISNILGRGFRNVLGRKMMSNGRAGGGNPLAFMYPDFREKK